MSEDFKYSGASIDLDEISGRGTFIKPGNYLAHLAAVNGIAESKSSKKPMVQATWEIAEGENEGLELYTYYTMFISPPKKPGGKFFAPGIADLKATLAALGEPLPSGFQFPVKDGAGDYDKAAKLLGQRGHRKLVMLKVIEEPMKDRETKEPVLDDEGKPRMTTRTKLMGLANAKSADSELIDDLSEGL